MTMKSFKQGQDPEFGHAILGMNWTDIDSLVLGAGVATRYAIPTNTAFLLAVSTKDVYLKFGTVTVDAVVPAGDVLDGSASGLNPGLIIVDPTYTHVSLISAEAAKVTIYRWKK